MEFENQWSPEEIDLLISLVRDQQDLYDQSRSSYSNMNATEKCWRYIAQHFPTKNVKLCKAKWQILRGTYRAKKQSTQGTSGSSAKPPVKWPYFSSLSFLDKHLKDRKSHSNIISDPRDQESDRLMEEYVLSPETGQFEKETEETLTIQVEEINNGNSSLQSAFTPKYKKKKVDPVEESFLNYLEEKKKSSIRLFLESLEEDISKLSPRALSQFKREMLISLEDHLIKDGKI